MRLYQCCLRMGQSSVGAEGAAAPAVSTAAESAVFTRARLPLPSPAQKGCCGQVGQLDHIMPLVDAAPSAVSVMRRHTAGFSSKRRRGAVSAPITYWSVGQARHQSQVTHDAHPTPPGLEEKTVRLHVQCAG